MTAPVMPEPAGGWHSRRARRKAERAWARDLDTGSRQRAAGQRTADRKAGRADEPLTWPMRILAVVVAVVVLSVAAVIAAVVVGAGVGFYDAHLTDKNISFAALGIQTPLNLPTFTPLATEGLVWASTLLAIVMVLLGRTATLWTRSMWAFASVAAFVGSWFGINDEHDLFGGVLRGCLSLAGPYLVHLFILWCRHLRSGRTLAQARVDVEIRWRAIGRALGAVLVAVARHVRHPTIAARAVGYWLGIPGWDYRAAWQAASIGYRSQVQNMLDTASRNAASRDRDGDHGEAGEATTGIPLGSSDPEPVVAGDRDGDTLMDGSVMVAERRAFDEAEIDRLVAEMNDPNFGLNMVTDQRGSTTTSDDHEATTTTTSRRPRAPRETATDTADDDHDDDQSTTGGRQARRPRRLGGRGRNVAGTRGRGRPKPASDVDISGLLPDAREVASQLGDELRRERLLKGLRERGHTVGGQRRDALWEAIKAERNHGSTGQ